MAMIKEFGAQMEHSTDKQMVQNNDQESEPKLWKWQKNTMNQF